MENFDGSVWGKNGPEVMLRVLKNICPPVNGSLPNQCGKDFTILPQKSCYEITYPEWKKFFTDDDAKEVMERTRESYFIHLWNKMIENHKVKLDSKAAILTIAKESCPLVFHSRYDEF